MKTLALEFGTNMFGKLKPEIKKRLQAVIDKPCQKTWDDAYSIILNASGQMTTLWNAVRKVDCEMPNRRGLNEKWSHIPTSETIIKAINLTIFNEESKQKLN